MPFDSVTAAAIARELQEPIVGGRVQGLVMPGPLALALEIYRGGVGRVHLVMSAHPQNARVHVTPNTPSRDPDQHPPFLLLLRKYVRGGTVTGVQQLPHERVLRVSIDKRLPPDKHQEYHFGWDFGQPTGTGEWVSGVGDQVPEGPDDEDGWEGEDDVHPALHTPQWPITSVDIYIEVMGRLSNIVLVDGEGVILDAMKRIPPSLNRYRSTLPHQPYVAPPPQEKRDPLRASPNVLSVIMGEVADAAGDAPAWKGLVEGLRGISPTLAREAIYRAFSDVAVKADDIAGHPRELEKALGALRALVADDLGESATTAWHERNDGNKQAIDYASYRLTHLDHTGATLTEHTSMSEAIDTYYEAAGSEQLGGHSALKGQVRAELEEMLAREGRKLRAIKEELARSRALETLRMKGEMILAYMHTLEPGQITLKVEGADVTIALDPALTPVENAQAYFREYRKAQSAQAGLPEKVGEAQAAFDFWDGLVTSLDLASSYDDIRAVQEEMRAARRPPITDQPPPKPKKGGNRGKHKSPQEKLPQPLRLRTHHGAHLLVGRTAGQNDTATFRLASPDDLWMHARGAPGAHVILRAEGGYTESDVEEAASIAAAYSKLRNEGYVDVLVTERRNVRRVLGAPPGTATYKNERVVRVKPAMPGALEKK